MDIWIIRIYDIRESHLLSYLWNTFNKREEIKTGEMNKTKRWWREKGRNELIKTMEYIDQEINELWEKTVRFSINDWSTQKKIQLHAIQYVRTI